MVEMQIQFQSSKNNAVISLHNFFISHVNEFHNYHELEIKYLILLLHHKYTQV